MSFVIIKPIRPETCAGRSDIKYKLENMKVSHSKHEIPKANLQNAEWRNNISITGETYSEHVRHKLNIYFTSSFPLFKDYMESRSSERDEEEEFTADH